MSIVSGCEQLAKRGCMIRDNRIATHVRGELRGKYKIKVTRNWYEQQNVIIVSN